MKNRQGMEIVSVRALYGKAKKYICRDEVAMDSIEEYKAWVEAEVRKAGKTREITFEIVPSGIKIVFDKNGNITGTCFFDNKFNTVKKAIIK